MLDDREFVRAACELVFGPEPRADLMGVLERLWSQGWSKTFVLSALVDMVTGTLLARARFIERTVSRYRKASGKGWAAWYTRHVFDVETDFPGEVHLRRIARYRIQMREQPLQPALPVVRMSDGDPELHEETSEATRVAGSQTSVGAQMMSIGGSQLSCPP